LRRTRTYLTAGRNRLNGRHLRQKKSDKHGATHYLNKKRVIHKSPALLFEIPQRTRVFA
jgi:hypothetical protein